MTKGNKPECKFCLGNKQTIRAYEVKYTSLVNKNSAMQIQYEAQLADDEIKYSAVEKELIRCQMSLSYETHHRKEAVLACDTTARTQSLQINKLERERAELLKFVSRFAIRPRQPGDNDLVGLECHWAEIWELKQQIEFLQHEVTRLKDENRVIQFGSYESTSLAQSPTSAHWTAPVTPIDADMSA